MQSPMDLIVGVDMSDGERSTCAAQRSNRNFCYTAPDRASDLLALLLSSDLLLGFAVAPERGKITLNHLRLRSEQVDMVELGAVAIPLPRSIPGIGFGGASSTEEARA